MIVVVAALAAFLLRFDRRSKAAKAPLSPEALLLEEAIVSEPIAPGLEGRAEIRTKKDETLSLRARASDSNQAFARGTRVRVIDYREGCCFVESADELHLVH